MPSVRMSAWGAAEDHVEEQHHGGDDECPVRRQAEHDFEHDQSGNELAGQIEEQDERHQRDQHPDAFGLVAVAQVLRDRAVAEAVPGRWLPAAC